MYINTTPHNDECVRMLYILLPQNPNKSTASSTTPQHPTNQHVPKNQQLLQLLDSTAAEKSTASTNPLHSTQTNQQLLHTTPTAPKQIYSFYNSHITQTNQQLLQLHSTQTNQQLLQLPQHPNKSTASTTPTSPKQINSVYNSTAPKQINSF